MNIVLLSGGSGNRLWPLSTPENSKQFLKILKRTMEGQNLCCSGCLPRYIV